MNKNCKIDINKKNKKYNKENTTMKNVNIIASFYYYSSISYSSFIKVFH